MRGVLGAVLLSVLLGPAAARAQSFHVHGAPVLGAHPEVGTFHGPAALTFTDATHARITLASPIALQIEVDLARADVWIAAGVGQRTALEDTGAWSITMAPDHWAPLLSASTDGVRVALPRGLPVETGRIPSGTIPARGAPTTTFAPERVPAFAAPTDFARFPVIVRTSDPMVPSWIVPERARMRLLRRRAHGVREVEVAIDGFRVRALLGDEGPCECTLWHDAVDGMRRYAPRAHVGRSVLLPVGTELFATPTDAAPLGVVSRELVALEPLDPRPTTACTEEGCRRTPPLPSGPSAWRIQTDELDLHVWVHLDAATLTDVRPEERPASVRAVGPSPPAGWPRRAD